MNKTFTYFLLLPALFLFNKSYATIAVDSVYHLKVTCSSDTVSDSTGAIYVTPEYVVLPSYSWTGPNGFTSTSIDITGLTDEGQYKLVQSNQYGPVDSVVVSLGYSTEYGYFSQTVEVVSGHYVNIKNTSGSNNWCRGGGSNNVLADSTDGWIEYRATATNKNRLIGLSYHPKESSCWTYLDYGIYMKNTGSIARVIDGSETTLGTYSTGDLIRIARTTDTIRFYKNNVEYSSYAIAGVSQAAMMADVSVYGNGDEIENLACSFRPPVSTEITYNDILCDDTIGGAITLNPCGGDVYSYEWSNGDTTSSIVNWEVGNYSVTIRDTADWMTKKTISAGYSIFWDGMQNVTYSNRQLEKTSGSGSSWDAGGKSVSMMLPSTDGWVEYEITDLDKSRVIGLSVHPSSDHGLDSLDYGIRLHTDAKMQKSTSGTISVDIATIRTGDLLRIAREGTVIRAYINNYSTAVTSGVSTSDTMYIETSFYTLNGKFEYVRTSESWNCSMFQTSLVLEESPKVANSYPLYSNHLEFDYTEKYHVDDSTKLVYKLYDEDRNLLASVDKEGNLLDANSPVQIVSYGYNLCTLDLTALGLSSGEYFLEVFTPKNDKYYLRFRL